MGRSIMQLLMGPPTTVRNPRARQRDNSRSMPSFCTSMALMSTTSAHSKSASLTGRMLMSTRRCSQSLGNSEATVSSPSGGKTERLPSNGKACLKLQYVSGHSGYTRRAFIDEVPPTELGFCTPRHGQLYCGTPIICCAAALRQRESSAITKVTRVEFDCSYENTWGASRRDGSAAGAETLDSATIRRAPRFWNLRRRTLAHRSRG